MEFGPNLFHASGVRPDRISAELVAIVVVRDEMWRMPFFLAYHRWIGIQHFIVIDNRSIDGTSDFLKSEPDVTCILAPGDFKSSSYSRDWFYWALRLAPPHRWNLILDADELFIGTQLIRGNLVALTRSLDRECVSIAAASMVDCYPPIFPVAEQSFEPVPWQRAPYFDCGPYFQWPQSGERITYIYHGVRQRICWPYWSWRKIVPRPLRPRAMRDAPPWVMKMPLLRNDPGLVFQNQHISSGLPRSKCLFAILHFKFDIDLHTKVDIALRELQHAAGSREYKAYARVLSLPGFDMRCPDTRLFDGMQSLISAELVNFPYCSHINTSAADRILKEIVEEIWHYGDLSLQERVWHRTWS